MKKNDFQYSQEAIDRVVNVMREPNYRIDKAGTIRKGVINPYKGMDRKQRLRLRHAKQKV